MRINPCDMLDDWDNMPRGDDDYSKKSDSDNLRMLADFIDMQHRQGKWDNCTSETEVQEDLRRMAIDLESIEGLKEELRRRSYALSEIDCAVMDPEQAELDTKAVGGPVDTYCFDLDEKAVIDRVKKEVERLRKELLEAKSIATGEAAHVYELQEELKRLQCRLKIDSPHPFPKGYDALDLQLDREKNAKRRNEKLEKLYLDAMTLVVHGDYSNGNEHNGVDEGNIMAGGYIKELEAEAKELGLGSTVNGGKTTIEGQDVLKE